MKYNKTQRIISYILLFLFFFNITINLPPIFSLVLAKESPFYNLVSIIVDEKTYSEIKTELDRYSRDISGVLENTRVVILPVPENASAFQIASMNESMFFDGYKSLEKVDFESKLISTVFVGNIPLPTVYKGEDFTRTALPYVDFENKSYVFNREKNRYEENSSGSFEIKPEIEFSFISPNTGDFSEDIKSLKNFFDKNHDYYSGQGLYKDINGLKDNNLPYEPYVFYYDYFREVNGFNPNLYSSYMATRTKNEDLSYARYTKDLLKFMENASKTNASKELLTLAKNLDPKINLSNNSLDLKNIYDIQTRQPIEKLKKNFINSFSKGTLGELRKDVFNAGRYNNGQNVNVDFIPHIVSEIDIIADELLRQANNEIEDQTDKVVENISRKIAVPVSYSYLDPNTGEGRSYKNFLFGQDSSTIKNAEQCNFYRGSSQFVESNRGLNINLIQKDADRLKSMGSSCLSDLDGAGSGLNGLWGKNSPFYLDKNFSAGELKLKNGTDYKGAIEPLFDIVGSKKIGKGNIANINAFQCFDNNYLLFSEDAGVEDRHGGIKVVRTYQMKDTAWTCRTDNNSKGVFSYQKNIFENELLSFKDIYNPNGCDVTVKLDGKVIRSFTNPYFVSHRKIGKDDYETVLNCRINYDYKSVDSVVKHKEPLPETLKEQSKKMITPNIPIDENRYIDFIRADGKYININYLDFFDLKESDLSSLEKSYKNVEDTLKSYSGFVSDIVKLQENYKNIPVENSIKNHKDFGKLVDVLNRGKDISKFLLKGDYVKKDVSFSVSKPQELAFAVLWNNLSTSRKYSLIFEKYLSNDLPEINKNKPNYSQLSNIFKKDVLDREPRTEDLNFLPRLKKSYEISYLGANGDAQNMMIKFDPKLKEENPYADIISKNQTLSANILGHNISNSGGLSSLNGGLTGGLNSNSNLLNGGANGGNNNLFGNNSGDSNGGEEQNSSNSGISGTNNDGRCRPPNSVPLQKWLPAIRCRLKGMLPPKINISDGHCSADSILKYVGNKENNKFSFDNQVNSCSIDNNADGVSDCLESVNVLKISTDSNVYSHNSFVDLKASFYEKDSKATFVNNVPVEFEIVKVEKAKDETKEISNSNLEVVYDISNQNLKDESVLENLLSFSSIKGISSSLGEVKYGFSTKDKDLNIYIKSISKIGNKTIETDVKKIEIRKNYLSTYTTKYKKSTNSFENSFSSISSSNKTNIYVLDLKGKNLEKQKEEFKKIAESEENLLVVLDTKTSEIKYPLNIKVFKKSDVVQDLDIKTRQDFIKLTPIFDSGEYRLKITDSSGVNISRDISVLSSNIEKIDLKLGSSLILSGGSISTNVLTIYDKYNNPISGKNYIVDLSFDNNNFSFADSDNPSNLNFGIYEGFRIFRIKSSEKSGESNLTIKVLDSDTNKVVLSKIEKIKSIPFAEVSLSNSDFSVGGETYKFKVSIVDKNGKKIPGFNSRIYMVGDSSYFSTSKDYFDIKDSEAEIELTTGTISGKDIPVEFQIEGINKIFYKKINILPSLPVKIDVLVENPKIEASEDKFSTVYLELKDKYNNTVINDSTTRAKVEIEKKYSSVLTGGEEVQFKNGVASLKVFATNTPGTGYFKVKTEPSLAKNSFEIKDAGNTLKIDGYGENIGKIETFYFWNKQKIKKQNYNSIYSVLLGGNYGDIGEKDYLAGSLIFEKDSKALAVTTLLETGEKKNNILHLSEKGNLRNIFAKSDLSQDVYTNIGIDSGKLYFNIYNKSLNTSIGQIYYNLKNIKTGVCNSDFSDCLDKKETSIYGKIVDNNFNFYKKGNAISLADENGNELLLIDENGNFEKKSDITFEIDKNNSGKYLILKLISSANHIGSIAINLEKINLNISREENVFNLKKQTSGNSLLLKLDSSLYGSYKFGNDNIIYYNDPFSSSASINSFANISSSGFEKFKKQDGIGWKGDNKTLLSFASGKNVGSSVKDFMSFYTINIGDPFVSLKPNKKTFNGTSDLKQFDSTIGEIIVKDEDVLDYKVFDYNGDGRKDILLRKRDNYLKLLENKDVKQKFLDQGNLAQIYDLGNIFEVGDFTGDKFDDIFFVGKDGKPYLLNNISKDFNRFDLSNKLGIKSRISQASVFDMDNDGKTDLVILDESGELNIFYGGGNSVNPTFTKKNLATGLGISLSSNSRIDGGAIYYNGLYQPSFDKKGPSNTNDKSVDNVVIDTEIYEGVPYSKNKNVNNISNIGNNLEQTFFLKSEYFSSVGLVYEKKYKDRNGGILGTGDIVDVEIKLTNKSGKTISDVVLLEKFEKYFNIDFNSIKNSKNLKVSEGLGYYNFTLENFSLANGETLEITYTGKSKTLSSVNIRAGLFEKGEAGDDKHGDIIIDDFNLTCGAPISVFKSVGNREYQKGNSEEKCDVSKLPEDITKLSKDENKNGIPDYIDGYRNSTEELQKFSEEQLNLLNSDKDGDGITDDGDGFDGTLSSLEQGLDNVQNLLDGLSCGFNNGACISSPLNWAPLAPGSDPTFMGMPIGDGLLVEEGLPIFSALTYQMYGKFCGPSVWPPSVQAEGCSGQGAGGRLGTNSPSNFFRVFVTPTLTGGIGTAICLGGPASVVGYSSNPFGLAPLFPGGNCIVLAKPIIGCSNDGSEGDPSSIGEADNFSNFSIINAGNGANGGNGKGGSGKSCNPNTGGTSINPNYVKDYINSSGGKTNKSLLGVGVFKNAVEDHSTYDGSPLFNIDLGGQSGFSVGIVPTLGSSSENTDFSDIVKIAEERITSFPEFLMDWVVRQIDEIISKLTDFPTIFLILPDFTGIYDSNKSWEENWKDYKSKKSGDFNDTINTSGISGNLAGTNISGEKLQKNLKQVNSGIREAYEFIATLPLVNINQEVVNINIPWISDVEIDRAINSRKITVEQWKEEVQKYTKNGEYQDKVSVEINGLIGSIERNIEVLQSYKKIPDQIASLINKKEEYLYQILCNVEIISDILGGWIGKNGERFKSWVELYILIKAILKSWQSFIDIFVTYEEECKECKNERHDLLNYQFKAISMIIPQIPVVRFPKWPDIIIDLHNIRAGIDIVIPEFEITTKPIVAPNLPNLRLPSVPNLNANINLPEIGILKEFKLFELPDIPTLPTVELPDLPPAPRLPKLFEGFEFIIDIAKLVTKAMCILKTSPFHPEWRAGDQISFLTERNGFLSFDFISKSLPEFSLPFVDAIEVKTYVNLEYNTDFIVQLAEQMVKPVNTFTSDFTNKLKISIDDIDFSGTVPSDIDVNVDVSKKQSHLKNDENIFEILATTISKKVENMEKTKNETLTNEEFKKSAKSFLALEKIASDPRFDEIRETWEQVDNYTFSSEDKIINSLKEFNKEKFETLKNIIETERRKNKNLEKELKEMFASGKIKVSENNKSLVGEYNSSMDKFNKKTFENIGKVFEYDENKSEIGEIKNIGKDLQNRSNDIFGGYAKRFSSEKTPLDIYKNNLLASNNKKPGIGVNQVGGSCSVNSASNNSGYSYNYSGIYVLENGKSYRLFDYIDEVSGKEETTPIDFDNDGDEDLLYFVNNTLYLKENYSKKEIKKFQKSKPFVLSPSENKFLKNEFIEAVNNATESDISNSIINISFSSIKGVNNYRLSYYDIIDKYLNTERNEIDAFKNKHIVDGITSSLDLAVVEKNSIFTKRKDLVYLKRIGNFKGLEMKTNKLKAIKEDLLAGNTVTISSGTKLYSGGNILDINYKIDGKDEIFNLKLEPNTNLEPKQDIIIVGISRGNGFIDTGEEVTYNGDEISKMKGQPLLFDTKIYFKGDIFNLKADSYIDLFYYDNSETRINFNEVYSWELYDLGLESTEYLFSLDKINNYYYSRINPFKNNIFGTSTHQILLSPQLKADKNTPDIDLNSVKVPVYQEVEIDVTSKITEDSGVSGISKLFIDFMLEADTNGDGNTKNDDDNNLSLRIYKKDNKIFLKVGKFSNILSKKIGINVVDKNGNLGFKEVDFEVYSPIPEIESYDGVSIYGTISENLKDEPIRFYKFRAGNLSKIGNEKEEYISYTNEKGEFSMKTGTFKGGLTIKDKAGLDIASISEKTGKISINPLKKLEYFISISREENAYFPKISILEKSGKNIFNQILRVKGNSKVDMVEDFKNLSKNGVYVKAYDKNKFNYYVLPDNIVNNPGVFVGYNSFDKTENPILKIYPDGRIDFPKSYKLEYSEYNDYIVIKVYDNDKQLFDILYKIDADYVVN